MSIELFVASSHIWLYLHTAALCALNFFTLTVPWLVWGAIILHLFIVFCARIPPPSSEAVNKVLGVNPLTLDYNDIFNKNYVDNNKEFRMEVVAHRAAGYDYPENSMSAFANCFKKGVDAIEFDLSLTKDNVPIIFHDITIDRLTGENGYVQEMTWNELKEYDISVNHPLRSKFFPEGERIALLDEVLEANLQHDMRMFIDVKESSSEIVDIIVAAFQKYPNLYAKAAITTFNPYLVYQVRKRDPNIVAGIAWRPQIFSMNSYSGIKGPCKPRYQNLFMHLAAITVDMIHTWALEHITYYILGVSFILLQKDVISAEDIRKWNNRGIRILAWTVNLPTEKIHFIKNLRITYLTDTLLS